jgi:hypothetical protein
MRFPTKSVGPPGNLPPTSVTEPSLFPGTMVPVSSVVTLGEVGAPPVVPGGVAPGDLHVASVTPGPVNPGGPLHVA